MCPGVPRRRWRLLVPLPVLCVLALGFGGCVALGPGIVCLCYTVLGGGGFACCPAAVCAVHAAAPLAPAAAPARVPGPCR